MLGLAVMISILGSDGWSSSYGTFLIALMVFLAVIVTFLGSTGCFGSDDCYPWF